MSSELVGRSAEESEALVDRVRMGDSAAFEALYRLYVAELVQFAAGVVRSFEDAQDIVEEIFVSLWLSRTEWAPRYGARAYLFAAARNRALNKRRDTATARRMGEMAGVGEGWNAGDDVAGMGAAAPPIDESLEVAEQVMLVERAMATLPEVRRAVLELRFRQGMSGNEVAEALGISRNAVDLHVSRGLRTLRDTLPNLLDE